MYYAAKGLELLGMFMIAVGFVVKFPKLMDPRLLIAGLVLFGAGWTIEKYILK
jgi:hypothetical protein